MLLNPEDCKNKEICGPPDIFQLHASAGSSISAPSSESKLMEQGRMLGAQAKVDSVVCVELAHERQPWCLGIVEREIYTVEKDSTSWMG